MTTGYTPARAYPHDEALQEVTILLEAWGYKVTALPVDGHNPDLRVDDWLVDIKTSDRYPNLAIELECFHTWNNHIRQGRRILIIHRDPNEQWWVDTPASLEARITGGPRRRTPNGSNDDWYLIAPGGTRFGEWFRPK